MKKIIITIVTWGLLGGMTGFTQSKQYLKRRITQLIQNPVVSTHHIHQQLEGYIKYLATKRTRYKNERKFLKYLFFSTHKKFLKKYEMYQNFSEIFSEEQKYNCVSGTTLYALILQELGYQYSIRETAFHVYLIVHTPNYPKILFDSTDPHHGFLYNPYVVRKRERHYTKNNQHKFNQEITLSQLIGLQYYNQGVHHFNKKIFGKALVKLSKAYQHYPSSRIKALQELAQSFYKSTLAER
ncbi:hypothetical protein [Microscilla marina]|uniref:Protein SirB1 N-terminal domain-containing protein n=1 Tax=Microscilla marina ATCC 23134 TaxID=313606 RepID=A1ZKH1_MICM2|nr:hypothetical protein [Microscilla marina]EAY29197.1 hypothetical protein M23134_02388 [Microscilla marina ATCC 23134]